MTMNNNFRIMKFVFISIKGGGAWLVSQRAEQRRRFKAVLCAKPRTYSRIKEERKKAEREGTQITMAVQSLAEDEMEEEDEAPVLDGFFLVNWTKDVLIMEFIEKSPPVFLKLYINIIEIPW